jgi:hypothetical protein
VQKYWLTGLVIIVVVFAATFLVISWRNDPNAEAGPAPIINLTIGDDTITPDPLLLPAGRLVELRVNNDASQRHIVSSDADGIDQLPVETDLNDPHATGIAQSFLSITAGPGTTTAALVRFNDKGTYELRVAVPARDITTRILTLHVE